MDSSIGYHTLLSYDYSFGTQSHGAKEPDALLSVANVWTAAQMEAQYAG